MARIYERGLQPFDPQKHERFPLATDLGFSFAEPTYPIKKTGGLMNFGMLGNGPDPTQTAYGGKPVGNCGRAGRFHLDMMAAGFSGESIPIFTSDYVVTDYFIYEAVTAGVAWRPPPVGTPWSDEDMQMGAQLDQGVDLGDMLLYDFKNGNNDGFVALNLAEVDAALSQFGSVLAGWILTDQTDEDFQNGVVADVSPTNQPNPADGHCMPIEGVESAGGITDDNTWAGTLRITAAYRKACLQQAFLVLTKEQAAAHNFPLQATEAILKELGGQAA